jgi:ketosteroid isomerase-like protein
VSQGSAPRAEWARDERIAAVLECDARLKAALAARDLVTVERLYALELLLNSPANRIQTRQETLDLLTTSPARQASYECEIEAAYASGDVVVLMGREVVVWEGTGTPMDGRRTRRRFTTAWRRIDGEWKQILRQATNIGVES